MVARGVGAAGPVLLACRQWDPPWLARWLPSLGVGAGRSAPLLPWRVQCPVRVCAALAAGSGGSGQYLVLSLPHFPLPARHSAQGSGTRVGTGNNSASKPADQPTVTTPSWGRGHLDYARSEGGAHRPSVHAEQAAAQNLDLWIDRITTGERLSLAVSIRWLLTLPSRHLAEGTRTMVDVAFGNRAEPHAPPTTMDHPSQWHYVASRLMAHMGTYSPDEMNRLHWRWQQHAALRICAGLQRHNI